MNKIREFISKNLMASFVIFSILLAFASLLLGNKLTKSMIGQEKLTYDEVVQEIEVKEQQLDEKEKQLDDIETDIEVARSNYQSYSEDLQEISAEYDEVQGIISEKSTLLEEKEKVQNEIDKLKKTKNDLDTSISDKKSELSSLTGKVEKAKGQPKILSAGKFTVGKDIPAGRYKAVPNGGLGNFFVNSGRDVNVILGAGDFGEPEYVFDVQSGDIIEITTSVKFIPIE